jgi:hypothetical protein
MVTLSALVLFLGIAALGSGIVAGLLGLGASRSRRVVARLRPVPLAQWLPGRGRFAAVGRIRGGPVTAPVTLAPCAWYSASMVRRPPRGFDTEYVHEDVLWSDETLFLPVLSDGSAGLPLHKDLLVRPPSDDPPISVTTRRTFDHTQTHLIPRQLPPVTDVRDYEEIELTEIRIDAGIEVFVIARALRAGRQTVIGPGLASETILTTDGPDQVAARREANRVDARWVGIRLSVIGLAVVALGAAGLVLTSP